MYAFTVLKKMVTNSNEYKHRALSYYRGVFLPLLIPCSYTNQPSKNKHLPLHFGNADIAALYLCINTVIIIILQISVF